MALRTALFFEELEPRLLFSADLAGVDTEVLEQDYAEEPVMTAELESTAESDDTAALQAEDEESAGSTEPMESADGMESDASDTGELDAEPAGSEKTGKPHAASKSGEDLAGPMAEAESENIAPELTQPDGPVEYAGGEQPVLVAPAATVVDADSADFKQGTLSVSITAGGSADDDLSISPGGDVSLLNKNIKVEQKLVGSFAGGTDGAALVISWSPQATPDYAEAVLRQIAYSNDSAQPTPGSRTVDFVLTDGDGGVSNTVTSIINVIADGLPGSGPGPGNDDGDTGGAEIVTPIDKPIEKPVDEQDQTPQQIIPGDGELEISAGGREESTGSDGSEALAPSITPVIEPGRVAKMNLQPAAGKWPDGSTPAGDSREQNDPAASDSHAAQETENFFAAGNEAVPDISGPRPEVSVEYENEAGECALVLPEQPAAAGQELGDVSQEEKSNSETMKTTIGRLLDFFTPTAAAAAPVLPLIPEPVGDGDMPAENEKVRLEVESMRREMEEAFLQSTEADKLIVYTTTGASLSLTAGLARYFFQSGSLLSGFLATMPLWKGFDPVAVLSTPKAERKKAGAISPSTDIESVDQKAETMFAAQGEA